MFGMPIGALTMGQTLGIIDDTIAQRGRLLLGVVNAAKVVNMWRDERLREAVLAANLILADGMAVVWASRLLGRRLPERVTGIDLMHEMLQRGSERGYRVFCLGATDNVLDTTVARIHDMYPGVVVAGSRNGYFDASEEPEIAEAIRVTQPDILLAAMSSPKKEIFLARWFPRLDVPVCHGVGGAFDVLAGKVKRAPEVWQRLGLEWLYRVVQEPRRLWRRYLVTNTLFGIMVLKERFRRKPRSTPKD
jgi:N-acetylglucosaminyldiphosphoundecaprenol N-acetyl-beta-D-mannosaminyltransferase